MNLYQIQLNSTNGRDYPYSFTMDTSHGRAVISVPRASPRREELRRPPFGRFRLDSPNVSPL